MFSTAMCPVMNMDMGASNTLMWIMLVLMVLMFIFHTCVLVWAIRKKNKDCICH